MPFNATLWVLKESQIEGCKHQNDSDVHHQSFPEMVPEDQGIYSDDDGYHRHHVRHGNHRSCHCDFTGFCDLSFRLPRIRHVPNWLRQAPLRAPVNYTVGPVRPASVGVVRRLERDHHILQSPAGKAAFAARLKWSGRKTSGTRILDAVLNERLIVSFHQQLSADPL